MAPIDIVEAQSEVARNEETVIVAEAAIKQAEDRLRALIFDPAMPDFWNVTHRADRIDAASPRRRWTSTRAVRTRARRPHRCAALEEQPGAQTTSTSSISATRCCRKSTLRRVLRSNAASAACFCSPVHLIPLGGGRPRRVVASAASGRCSATCSAARSRRGRSASRSSYPLGTSPSRPISPRRGCSTQQAQTQLRNLELQIATQVRDAGAPGADQPEAGRQRPGGARAG